MCRSLPAVWAEQASGQNGYLHFHTEKYYGAIVTKWELLEQKLFLRMGGGISKCEPWFIC